MQNLQRVDLAGTSLRHSAQTRTDGSSRGSFIYCALAAFRGLITKKKATATTVINTRAAFIQSP